MSKGIFHHSVVFTISNLVFLRQETRFNLAKDANMYKNSNGIQLNFY